MATVSFFNAVAGYSTTDSQSTYTTASWTPVNGKLYIAWVVSKAASNAPDVTLSGNGMTWTYVTEHYSGVTRLSMFRAVATSPSAGVTTITPATATNTGMGWIIDTVTGADMGGSNGSNAIVQTALGGTTAATSQTATLGTAITSGNATFSAVTWAANETGTEKSGWTKLGETNGATPSTGFFSQYKQAGETGASASWTTSAGMRMITAEIKVAPGYRGEVMSDTPAIYWNFDETTGGPATLGSEALGTVTTGSNVTKTATGKVGGNAWQFNGTINDHVSVNDADAKYTDKVFSVEFFFKSTDTDKYLAGMNIGGTHFWYVYLTSGGNVYFTLKGSGTQQNRTTPLAYNDGAWHHVVCVANSTTLEIYVDGASKTSGSHTIGTFSTFSSGNLTVNYPSASSLNGVIDEFAIYDSALNSTRVAAHNTAASSTDGGYTAGVQTASAEMVDPGVTTQRSGGYTAQAMTASAAAPTAVVHGNTYTAAVTADTMTKSSNPTTNYGSTADLDLQSSDGTRGWLLKWDQTVDAGEGITTQTLKAYMWTNSTAGNKTFDVYRLDGSWAEGTVTHNTLPSKTFLRTVTISVSIPPGPLETIDVSGAGANGVYIQSTTSGSHVGMEAKESAFDPYVILTTSPIASVSPSADAMTASEAMPDASISTGSDVSASGSPLAVTALVVDPAVSVVGNPDYAATPMTASADFPGGLFSVSTGQDAAPFTASATIVEASAGAEKSPIIDAGLATASSTLVQAALINGSPILLNEAEDDYFVRTITGAPWYWFRLNQLVEGEFENRIDYRKNYRLRYNGVVIDPFGGPAQVRSAVSFDGVNDWLGQEEPVGGQVTVDEDAANSFTLEFTMKTDKPNEYLFGGTDNILAGTTNAGRVEQTWWLKDGKIEQRRATGALDNPLGNSTTLTGFTNLADNQWHHVAIRGQRPIPGGQDGFIEIYVDGVLEIRRRTGVQNPGFTVTEITFMGFPDSWGAPVEKNFLGVGTDYEFFVKPQFPGNQYFAGKMTELVYYPRVLSVTDIQRNFYAVMGIKPVYGDPLEASATMADAAVRGSKPRLLYLLWSDDDTRIGDEHGQAFDPFQYIYQDHVYERFASSPINGIDMAGFDVYTYSIKGTPVFNESNNTGKGEIISHGLRVYRDERTEDMRLIDLEEDINLDEFDAIAMRDWFTDNAYFASIYGGFTNWEQLKAKFISQLKGALEQGMSMFISHPQMAVDMGIVDRIEFCDMMQETHYTSYQKGNEGCYDYGSVMQYPFTGPNINDPLALSDDEKEKLAHQYFDVHKNNKFRIRATIPGLTDWDSWMPGDAVAWVEQTRFAERQMAFKYLKRETGLQIGDEFLFHGPMWQQTDDDGGEETMTRYKGVYAVPPGHVLTGTVLTTLGSKLWQGHNLIDNPFRDHATMIVLQPGDTIGDTVVNGKVVVSLAEQTKYNAPMGLAKQLIPENGYVPEGQPNKPPFYESPRQREWDYAFTLGTRVSLQGADQAGVTQQLITEGSNQNITIVGAPVVKVYYGPGGAKKTELGFSDIPPVFTSFFQLWPLESHAYLTMTARAWIWLADRAAEIGEGDNVVHSSAITASATMPDASTEAQHEAVINAQALVSNATLVKPSNVADPDVNILVLPATASATIVQPGKVIVAEPMLVNAELVENLDFSGTGEQVVMYLVHEDATLYIKEDA